MSNFFLNRIRELNKDITIRPAEETDAGAFIALMNSQYQRKKTDHYFRWQFMNAPIPVRLFVACHGSSLIGSYGVQIQRLTNGVSCGFTVDLIIAPAFRNRGLFALLEYEVKNFALSHGCVALACLPNPAGMKAHTGLRTWRNIGAIKTTGFSFRNDRFIDIEMRPFRSIKKETISFFKNEQYREWRFFQHPEYTYSKYFLNSETFSISKIYIDPLSGNRYGDIVDFKCDLNQAKEVKYLFIKTSLHLKEKGIENITTWALPHTPLFEILSGSGFKSLPQERFFCISVLNPEYENLCDFQRWELVQSDSEIY